MKHPIGHCLEVVITHKELQGCRLIFPKLLKEREKSQHLSIEGQEEDLGHEEAEEEDDMAKVPSRFSSWF